MEKMSHFISIVPTVPNSTMTSDNYPKRRPIQASSRYRRFRGYRRINNQRNTRPSIQNNESTSVEEISDEVRFSIFF